jgi:futalosine hydrolase
VRLEAEPLLSRLISQRPVRERSLDGWEARLGDRPIVAVVAGMGKTNAARALTALLERRALAGVIGFGIAGAYPAAGLAIGSVALAAEEHYGDEGAETPAGWISAEGIGIPLLRTEGGDIFNAFPVDQSALAAARVALGGAGAPAGEGPFVTVSSCSGTAARGAELEGRFGAICETMEGAAYAHVAAFYRTPFLEVRGISNLVEDRDPSRWRIAAAAEAVAAALPIIVAAWPHVSSPSNPDGFR